MVTRLRHKPVLCIIVPGAIVDRQCTMYTGSVQCSSVGKSMDPGVRVPGLNTNFPTHLGWITQSLCASVSLSVMCIIIVPIL